MRRLLQDFDELFDLDFQVSGTSLRSMVQDALAGLDSRSFDEWGTAGDRESVVSRSDRFVHFHYRPHLFPGMELKLRLAHELQFHLLPREVPPDAPLSLAAVLESYCHLSGDLFGWQQLRDGKFLLWIVDMSGHGLPAGLASAVLYLLVDSLRERSRLYPMVSELNRTLHGCIREGQEGLFATAFFLALGPDGHGAYSSAGHPPVLVRRENGDLERLERLDRPLGLFPDTTFRSRPIRLHPDDCLVLYTDGLLEARGRDGEEFGTERLERIVAQGPGDPRRLAMGLYEAMAARQNIDKLEDDVTLLAARFLPAAGS